MPALEAVPHASLYRSGSATHQELLQLAPVLLTHKPVSKHPAGLVQPQAGQGLLAVAGGGCGHEEALELLAEVTQVEGVVALGRCGQQLLRYPAPNAHKNTLSLHIA